jgi:hypothetical protein
MIEMTRILAIAAVALATLSAPAVAQSRMEEAGIL